MKSEQVGLAECVLRIDGTQALLLQSGQAVTEEDTTASMADTVVLEVEDLSDGGKTSNFTINFKIIEKPTNNEAIVVKQESSANAVF